MRVTDQYFWNIVFSIFFLTLVVLGIIILDTEATKSLEEVTVMDMVLISLATFRLIRLFVYDKITAFFREQFYDVEVVRKQVRLVKPERGPKRTILDLLLCPWCLGVWAGAVVTFFYFLTPLSHFPVLFLALAGVASFIQILINMIGWKAEQLKGEVEKAGKKK